MRVLKKGMRFLTGALVAAALLLPIANEIQSLETDIVVKIPTLKMNMYVMGMDQVDPQVYLNIGENIDYLNQEFEGKIGFELNELFMDQNGAYLPDLYDDFKQGDQEMLNRLVNPIEKDGSVNIYIFHTFCEEGTDQALMGFTPVLRHGHDKYQTSSPSFDRIFIAYEGLEDKTTLVHEMGHFLGLKHPWEMTEYARKAFGMQRFNVDQNHMNYGSRVDHFTPRQLDVMRSNALDHRQYLTKKVEAMVLKP